jgi:hypothetical protein
MATRPLAGDRWPVTDGRWPVTDGRRAERRAALDVWLGSFGGERRWAMSRPLPRCPAARCRWARPLADGRWPMADGLGRCPLPLAGGLGRWPVAGGWPLVGMVGWLGSFAGVGRLAVLRPGHAPRSARPLPAAQAARRLSELRPPRARLLLRNESDPRRSSENPVGVRAKGPFARTSTTSYRETTRERAARPPQAYRTLAPRGNLVVVPQLPQRQGESQAEPAVR